MSHDAVLSENGRSHSTLIAIFIVVLLPLCTTVCFAQVTTTATVSGTLRDPSGAILPGAKITVINTGTGVVTESISNGSGGFSVTGLPVGNYEVRITSPAFATYTETSIYLGPASVHSINAVLKPASVTQAITVTAAAAQVQTDTPEVSNQVSQQEVEALPLNGRSYEGLAALMPGVTNLNAGSALGTGGFITQNSMNINGTGQTGTLYTIDGIWNMQTSNMQETTIKPNPDAIQEVKVLANNYGVEYNIMGANAVVVQLKSGTSAFHGGGWEFLRNDVFDARNYFATTVPKQRQNIFGWNLGGPAFIPGHYNQDRQKTFFYINQQWVRQQQPMVFNGASPTASMRGINTPNGDALFPSKGLYSTAFLKDPTKTGSCNASSQAACFAKDANGNWLIPAARLNQNSLAFLNALAPLPNNQTTAFNNYINLSPAINNQLDQIYKVDHNIRQSLRLTGEFMHEAQDYTYPRGQRLGSAFPSNFDVFTTHNSLAQIQLAQTISPAMTNQTSVSMNRYIYYHDIDGISKVSQISGYQQNLPYQGGYLQNYLPALSFSGGWSIIGTRSPNIVPRFSELENMVTDNWSWLRGKHFIQAGGTLLWGTHREYSNTGNTTGDFSFNGNATGNSIADFLLGDAATFSQSSRQVDKHLHYPLDTFYLQDQWHVMRRLTLTGGFRWYFMPKPDEQPGYEVVFDQGIFDPAKAPIVSTKGNLTFTPSYDPYNGLIQNGVNGVPLNLTSNHQYYISPVIGFAWDVHGDGKTSLRGGYSINYTKSSANSDCAMSCITAPVILNTNLVNVNFPNPTGGTAAPPTAPNIYGEQRDNMRAVDVDTYSLSLQHQFTSNWFISIAGAGNKARHIPQMLNINQPGPVTQNGVTYDFNPLINTGNYANAYFAPFQGYSTINWYVTNAYANWNALETVLKHPIGHNVFWNASYTWSHNLSTLSGQQFGITGSTPQNSNNPEADYGNTTANRPHVFTSSFIYTLPWFTTGSYWQRFFLGGWKFADMTTLESGASLSPGLSASHQGLATRPSVIGSLTYPKTPQQWFTASAYAQPAAGYFGNAARGSIVGPGLILFDVAAYKDIHLSERFALQWRTEFFNVLNHTNFNAPNTNFGAGAFGTISSALDPRMGEMALKLTF